MANILNILDKDTGKYVAIPSIQGESAYEIAVKHGYEGTEEEWAKTLSSGESSTTYRYARKEPSYNNTTFASERKLTFELPTLPTYDGGTKFYCEPTPIVPGETDYYKEVTILAGEKETGFETDDAFKTESKFYVNSSYESFVDDVYAPVYNTTAGTLEDYIIRGIVREKKLGWEPAMLLFRSGTTESNSHFGLTTSEFGMYGTVTVVHRVWLYPISYFTPIVNGQSQPTDILVSSEETYELAMHLITKEQYLQLINSYSGEYGRCTGFQRTSDWVTGKGEIINTSGYDSDGYVMVLYTGNDTGESGSSHDLYPFISFTVHSCAYDYLKYKVWTTSMDGSESSAKYTLTLTEPLGAGEYIRYSSDPLYSKHTKILYKKSEGLNLYGVERFTGEYDDESNPIFIKTLHIDAAEKSPVTSVDRYVTYVKHEITGLIKWIEITPTWHRTIPPKVLAYTGNCFALDENGKNVGIYDVKYPSIDAATISWNYLQIIPTDTTIGADRGCNVWCYDCDVVLKYTRELTEADYKKYKF